MFSRFKLLVTIATSFSLSVVVGKKLRRSKSSAEQSVEHLREVEDYNVKVNDYKLDNEQQATYNKLAGFKNNIPKDGNPEKLAKMVLCKKKRFLKPHEHLMLIKLMQDKLAVVGSPKNIWRLIFSYLGVPCVPVEQDRLENVLESLRRDIGDRKRLFDLKGWPSEKDGKQPRRLRMMLDLLHHQKFYNTDMSVPPEAENQSPVSTKFTHDYSGKEYPAKKEEKYTYSYRSNMYHLFHGNHGCIQRRNWSEEFQRCVQELKPQTLACDKEEAFLEQLLNQRQGAIDVSPPPSCSYFNPAHHLYIEPFYKKQYFVPRVVADNGKYNNYNERHTGYDVENEQFRSGSALRGYCNVEMNDLERPEREDEAKNLTALKEELWPKADHFEFIVRRVLPNLAVENYRVFAHLLNIIVALYQVGENTIEKIDDKIFDDPARGQSDCWNCTYSSQRHNKSNCPRLYRTDAERLYKVIPDEFCFGRTMIPHLTKECKRALSEEYCGKLDNFGTHTRRVKHEDLVGYNTYSDYDYDANKYKYYNDMHVESTGTLDQWEREMLKMDNCDVFHVRSKLFYEFFSKMIGSPVVLALARVFPVPETVEDLYGVRAEIVGLLKESLDEAIGSVRISPSSGKFAGKALFQYDVRKHWLGSTGLVWLDASTGAWGPQYRSELSDPESELYMDAAAINRASRMSIEPAGGNTVKLRFQESGQSLYPSSSVLDSNVWTKPKGHPNWEGVENLWIMHDQGEGKFKFESNHRKGFFLCTHNDPAPVGCREEQVYYCREGDGNILWSIQRMVKKAGVWEGV